MKRRGRPKKRSRYNPIELLRRSIQLVSAGKEFLVTVTGLITAMVAMSSSCDNFKRTDASYEALAAKMNEMSHRLEAVEDAVGVVQADVIPDREGYRASAAPAPAPPAPSSVMQETVKVFPMLQQLKAVPKRLPMKLDDLMEEQKLAGAPGAL